MGETGDQPSDLVLFYEFITTLSLRERLCKLEAWWANVLALVKFVANSEFIAEKLVICASNLKDADIIVQVPAWHKMLPLYAAYVSQG